MPEAQGPLMIVATDALASPKIRVGHIAGNFTLPRTVPLSVVVGTAIGAIAGIATILVVAPGIGPLMFATVIGGALGYLAVTYSPLKNESLARYLGLQITTRRRRIRVDGDVKQLAVGIAVLRTAVLGSVRIVPSALDVPPEYYDERGTPLHHDDILRSTLGSAADAAATVVLGARSLDEYAPRDPFAPRRAHRRPPPTVLPPRVVAPATPPPPAVPAPTPPPEPGLDDLFALVPSIAPSIPSPSPAPTATPTAAPAPSSAPEVSSGPWQPAPRRDDPSGDGWQRP